MGTVMRTVRENSALLIAVSATNLAVCACAEALYAQSIRRSLRAILRFG